MLKYYCENVFTYLQYKKNKPQLIVINRNDKILVFAKYFKTKNSYNNRITSFQLTM